jgi:hypothetical protein
MTSTRSQRAVQAKPKRQAPPAVGLPAESRATTPSLKVLWAPVAATLLLALMSLHPRVQQNEVLVWSFLGSVVALLIWAAALYVRLSSTGQTRFFILTAPKKQHYIQAMCHSSIFLYWGFFWRPVYDYFWLMAAQLVFAYAFDMLLSWSRRGSWIPGFGPFPIIFSTNLFLWFRDDWFYLQFMMLAVGFLGKEFFRWNRDGRSTHIFNPSAFSLGLFSVILIVTGTTSLTWGPEIASTLSLAPNIYLYLFLVGLVVMYFFSITLVAASAAAVLFGLSALYSSITGVPYFLDTEIPSAVFLGLHLLITDPSTSPRTPPGRLVFGVLYGVGVFTLYSLLSAIGAPTFYDKLMVVPLLNLSVQRIDALVRPLQGKPLMAKLGLAGLPGRSNLAHMSVWILFFVSMGLLGKTDSMHPGDSLPFWQQACEEGRPRGCERLILLESTYCADNSAWACNELGANYAEGRIVEPDPELANRYFARACDLRFQAGCVNTLDPTTIARDNPKALDLRLLLREGGRNLTEMPEPELYARACEHDWQFACSAIASNGMVTGAGS